MESQPWKAHTIKRVIQVFATSTRPARVTTDAGPAFIKAMGNPEGPHALACELLGTRLARWLGLPVFDLCLIDYQGEPSITFPGSGSAVPGPALAIRHVEGRVWDGTAEDLRHVQNKEAMAALVVFDTWTRNPDRFFPREGREPMCNLKNVFFSEEGAGRGKYLLVAMDHTACFRGHGDLTSGLANIANVRDPSVYGMFEAFRPHITPARVAKLSDRLGRIETGLVEQLISEIPEAWEVSHQVRAALTGFIVDRARFMAQRLEQYVGPEVVQLTLPLHGTSKT